MRTKNFNEVIADYLKQRAAEDTLFAPKFTNPKKNIDECCRYILGEARKRGKEVVMTDDEVFGLAIHYYPKYIKIQSHHTRHPYNQCIIWLTLCYDFG